MTLIRKLHDTDNSPTIYFSQCAVGLCFVLFGAFGEGGTIGPAALVMLLGIGVFATAGQLLMTEGYRYLPVRTGSLLSMLETVLAYAAGVVIFDERLSIQSIVGAMLIVGACATVLGGRKEAVESAEIVEVRV